jgi:hypothetical protein
MCSHDDRVHVSVIVVLFALDSVTLFHLIVISSADESLRHGWFQLRAFLHLVELGTDLLLPCFHNNCHPIVSESSLTKLGMRPRSAVLFLFPTFLLSTPLSALGSQDWSRFLYSDTAPGRCRWIQNFIFFDIWYINLAASRFSHGGDCWQQQLAGRLTDRKR